MALDPLSRPAPLAGLSVVDLSYEAGARYCGRLFAALGAKVARVTDTAALAVSAGDAAFGDWLDAGKAPVASFADAVRHLGGQPHAVIAGQSQAGIEAADREIKLLGLNAVRLGLTWFGSDGPYASWKGDDALIQALIGVASSFGDRDGPPMLPQGRAPQMIGGATLFLAGLAALWGRRRGGVACRVDVNVLEASLAFTETSAASLGARPGRTARSGVNRFAVNYPMGIFKTADGWLGVTALTPAQWKALARLVGHAEWAEDPNLATSLDRVARADRLDAEFSRILATRTTNEWLIEGQACRIPLAPVPRHVELLATAHWRERGSFAPLPGTHPAIGPGLPFRLEFDGVRRDVGSPAPAQKPLRGLRVIDFSMGWAGPLATRHLGDLGADVVKVESELHYDWWRGWEPPGASQPPEYELKAVFNAMNRSKRGVTLDLTSSEGRADAKALVADADMVVENFAPGVMDKLGLGRRELQAARPGLIFVSMGAFGAVGPWRSFRAYGSTVEQASGMPHLNGRAEWPPCLQHGAYGDPVAGVYGAVAALTALHARAAVGGGWIDLAQVECLFQLGADAIIAAQIEGDPPRLGSRNRHFAPRCVVGTADPNCPVAVVVRNGDEWASLCRTIGRADWAGDPQLADPAGRNARGDEIEAELSRWAGARKDGEAAALALQNAGVPAAPVIASHALVAHPHHEVAGSWMGLHRRHVGWHLMASPPYRLDGARPAVERPAPLLGEHNDELLSPRGAAARTGAA